MTSLTFILLVCFVAVVIGAPSESAFELKLPEECRGKKFCSIRPEGYDAVEKAVEELLSTYKLKLSPSVEDRDGEPLPKPEYSPDSDSDNCPKVKETHRPFSVLNNEGGLDVVVQVPRLQQIFHTVKCDTNRISAEKTKSGKECFQKNSIFAVSSDKKFNCKTHEGQRTLFVFDRANSNIVMKQYSLDICCSCRVNDVF